MRVRALGALVLVASLAQAAETTVDERGGGERIDFDGAVIEGTAARPAGAHVGARAPESFGAMIDERADFRDAMADELPDIEAPPAKRPVRVAQAGNVDPCRDEIYLQLKAKDLESLSDREFEVFKAKDQACNEARVRAVATPVPTATPATVVVPNGGDFSAAPTPTSAATAPAKRFGQPWGAKELLLLMFGGVALLLLMMGGMILLVTLLAG